MARPVSERWGAGPGTALVGLLVASSVVVPTLWGGGFSDSSRMVFIGLGAVALASAVILDRRCARAGVLSPIALSMGALSVLSLLSAIWTLGSVIASLRWGLVIAAEWAVFVSALVFTRRTSAWVVAAGIAALAVVEAIVGIDAAAHHALPDAERLVRVWRPGGTYEYQPALALLEAGAIPVFGIGFQQDNPYLAGSGAIGASLAGCVLALADSRLALALTGLILLTMICRPSASLRQRFECTLLAAMVASGALVGALELGGTVSSTAPGQGMAGLSTILAVAAGSAGLAIGARNVQRVTRISVLATGTSVAVLAGVAIAATLAGWDGDHAVQHHGRHVRVHRGVPHATLTHGRVALWHEAIDTWWDRPSLGAGADMYLVASYRHQNPNSLSRFAHNLPLEAAAELGAVGLLLTLAVYAASLKAAWRARASSSAMLLGPFMVCFLVSNLFDWTWHLTGLTATWAAAAGAVSAAAGDWRVGWRRS